LFNCCYFVEISPYSSYDRNCLHTPSGDDYTGHHSHTVTGTPCQRWVDKYPHAHVYDDITYFADYRASAVIHDVSNYCRNPVILAAAEQRPWCYTTNDGLPDSYEFCDIPRCKRTRYFSATFGINGVNGGAKNLRSTHPLRDEVSPVAKVGSANNVGVGYFHVFVVGTRFFVFHT